MGQHKAQHIIERTCQLHGFEAAFHCRTDIQHIAGHAAPIRKSLSQQRCIRNRSRATYSLKRNRKAFSTPAGSVPDAYDFEHLLHIVGCHFGIRLTLSSESISRKRSRLKTSSIASSSRAIRS